MFGDLHELCSCYPFIPAFWKQYDLCYCRIVASIKPDGFDSLFQQSCLSLGCVVRQSEIVQLIASAACLFALRSHNIKVQATYGVGARTSVLTLWGTFYFWSVALLLCLFLTRLFGFGDKSVTIYCPIHFDGVLHEHMYWWIISSLDNKNQTGVP